MGILKKNHSTDYILLSIILFVLVIIGLDIAFYLEYFYLDNPAWILGAGNPDTLKNAFFHNIRLDFMYRLFLHIVAVIFGQNASAFYISQFLLFCVLLIEITIFGYRKNESLSVSLCISSLLLIASPFAENVYTIGKQEILVSVGMASVIIILDRILCSNSHKKKVILCLLLFIVSMLSFMSKETAFVIVLVCPLLCAFRYVFDKKITGETIKAIIPILIAFFIIIIYKRIMIIESNYTSISLNISLFWNNIIYYTKYNFDVVFLGVLSLGINIYNVIIKGNRNESDLLALVSCLCGWAYLFGISFWKWALSYYIFPCTPFFVISLYECILCFRHIMNNGIFRIICVLLAFISIIYGVEYNFFVAQAHKQFGISYTQSMLYINDNIESERRIIIVDWPTYVEPIYQTRNLLDKYYNNDYKIYGGLENTIEYSVDDSTLESFNYSRNMYNEEIKEAKFKEGDIVIHYIRDCDFWGPVRAVNPSNTIDTIGMLQNEAYELELLDADMNTTYYIGTGNNNIGINSIQSGYQIYEIKKTGYRISGIYVDGWISNEGLLLSDISEGESAIIRIVDNGKNITGENEVGITIKVDNKYEYLLKVKNGDEIVVNNYFLDKSISKHTFLLECNHYFVPKEFGINDDNRLLGINVSIDVNSN